MPKELPNPLRNLGQCQSNGRTRNLGHGPRLAESSVRTTHIASLVDVPHVRSKVGGPGGIDPAGVLGILRWSYACGGLTPQVWIAKGAGLSCVPPAPLLSTGFEGEQTK
jgi:hypothetical protein